MKEAVVNEELCTGCGECVEKCPEVFELRDDKAYVIAPEKCDSADFREAMEACPSQAIEIIEG